MAALLFLSGCNNKTEQFKVTLNLDNADKQTVYLCKDVDGDAVCIDSTVFAGKQAVLKADCDDPQTLYFIKFDPEANCGICAFFTENQNTTITGDFGEMQKWTFKGCATMDTYNAYRQELMSMEETLEGYFEAGDMEKLEAGYNEYIDYRYNYIKDHSDSYFSHYLLLEGLDEFGYERVKEAAEGFATESVYSKRIKDYLDKYARLEVGAPFIDFTLKTAEGEEVNLETVINSNRVVLVDFWASWCGPCRGENPFVKAAYEKYHADGFEIIGVSVDQDEEAWLKAVADDGMTWIQVRDVDNAASKDYMIQYIPSNFLYDGNGVMIAKGLRGEALEAKLAEVLQ